VTLHLTKCATRVIKNVIEDFEKAERPFLSAALTLASSPSCYKLLRSEVTTNAPLNNRHVCKTIQDLNAAETYYGENFQTRSNTRRFAFIRIRNETKHRFNCIRGRTAIRCHHSLLDSKHEVSLFRKRHSVCMRVRPAIYYPLVFEIAVGTQAAPERLTRLSVS